LGKGDGREISDAECWMLDAGSGYPMEMDR